MHAKRNVATSLKTIFVLLSAKSENVVRSELVFAAIYSQVNVVKLS
jgi:hypothetical protein